MGRIQASTGLVTGVPIADTVEQLMAFSARPRELLIGRTEQLKQEQVALTEMTAMVVGVQFAVQKLADASLFAKKDATSSNDALISATVTGNPAVGTHRYTPVRQAQNHQVMSSGLADADTALGAGTLSLSFGGFVDQGLHLDELNGGLGVQRGEIRITDRSGISEAIDLRFAQTVDDVLDAINGAGNINVTAVSDGDSIRLVDNTGQSQANLRVQEVGLGTTASDLGLAGINTAASEATGQDLLRLFDGLSLDRLNGGNGVALREGVADLEVTLGDGSTLQIEFLASTKGETASTATTTGANGVNAQVLFTSTGVGAPYDGYEISFVDDETVTAGNETVEIDDVGKTLTFHIDAGKTRAYQVVDALNNDATASQKFTASAAPGGDATGLIDTSDTATTSGGAVAYNNESSLGELLATINAADPTRLQAAISASGDRIVLTDLTQGSGSFSVSSLYGGSVAEDLGLASSTSSGVISGRRRLAGLQTVLLDNLGGGQGLGSLGLLSITDRSGSSTNVDLSTAETLDDVLTAINSAGVGVVARVNDTRNGILLADTSGGGGNLVVASGDGTAENLNLTVNGAVSAINSGSLHLQTIHESTLLDSLNRGEGVYAGSFLITDSQGNSGGVNLALSGADSLGDVIQQINALSIDVTARINDSGDGLLLVDTANGSETMTVSDVGNGTSATDLKIAGIANIVDVGGTPTQMIDGSTAIEVTLDADDTLEDLVERINELDAGVAAGLFNAGGGSAPYRLSLVSELTGAAGEMLIDGSDLGIQFQDIVAAQDALILVGSPDIPGASILASSTTNEFEGLIDGVTLHVNGASNEEVLVTIAGTDESVVSQVELFVDQYNKLRDLLDEMTFFDENANTTGILFGTLEALRVDVDLAHLITSPFVGTGEIQSLEELGLSLDDQGKLQFDKGDFRAIYSASPDAVEQFFAHEEFGAVTRFENLAEQLAGEEQSVLLSRVAALQRTIDSNEKRITKLGESLDRERDRLYNTFYQMELIIGQMQTQLNAVAQIQPLSPLTARS